MYSISGKTTLHAWFNNRISICNYTISVIKYYHYQSSITTALTVKNTAHHSRLSHKYDRCIVGVKKIASNNDQKVKQYNTINPTNKSYQNLSPLMTLSHETRGLILQL